MTDQPVEPVAWMQAIADRICPDAQVYGSWMDRNRQLVWIVAEEYAKHAPAALVPESTWISVEEQVPQQTEPITPVLCYYPETGEYAVMHYFANDGDFIGMDGDWSGVNPTHWQPLPNPPAEKGKKP